MKEIKQIRKDEKQEVRFYLAMVVEIVTTEPVLAKSIAMNNIMKTPGFRKHIYVTDDVQRLYIVREKELERHGLKIGGGT